MQAAPLQYFKLPTGEISFTKGSRVPSLGRRLSLGSLDDGVGPSRTLRSTFRTSFRRFGV